MPTWTQTISDNFNRTNTVVNGAPGSTSGVGAPSGAAPWVDNAGGVWSVQGGALIGSTANQPNYLNGFLVRPAGENQIDQRVAATFTASNSNPGVVLRVQPNADHYMVTQEASTIVVWRVVGGVATQISVQPVASGINLGSPYVFDVSAVGINPTTIAGSLLAGGVIVQALAAVTDASPTLQTSGSTGVICWANATGTAVSQAFSQIVVYHDETATAAATLMLPSAFGAFQGKISVGGEPVQLGLSPALLEGVVLTALPTNKAPLLVGGPGVTSASDGTGNGYPIGPMMPTMSISLNIGQANLVWLNGAAGDGWAGICI